MEHADRWGIEWRIEAFQKSQANPRPRFENLLNPLAILAELSPDRILLAPDRAELRGLEVSAAYQREHWAWHVAYTWSDAVDSKQGVDTVRGWDQTHAFSGAAQWRSGRWTAGAAISVHTGWPTTPLLKNTNDELTIGTRNGRRWPTYASLDMRVGYRLPLTRGELLFAIDLTNVLDRRNRCCSELIARSSSDGTSVAAEPLSLLPVTPIFLVRWNF